jgi:hypothetical protein
MTFLTFELDSVTRMTFAAGGAINRVVRAVK